MQHVARRDARKQSEVSTRIDLPSVHVPSARSRERKVICNSRARLLAVRTKLINYVRATYVLRRRCCHDQPRNISSAGSCDVARGYR